MDFDGISRFSITDELLGVSEGQAVTISLLLHPTCEATFERDGALLIAVTGLPLVRLVSTGPLVADIIRGDASSNLGWISPSFGVRVPTDQIVFKGTLSEPSTIAVNLLS